MTLQTVYHAHPFHDILDAVKRTQSALAEQRITRRAYNQTFAELSAFTNRQLADVGIRRADIPQIALEAAARRALP